MPRYRWESPLEWLEGALDRGRLTEREVLYAILYEVDNDTIQDLFQGEMDLDGYFRDLDEMCVCGHRRDDHNEDDHYCEAGVLDEAGRICGDCECEGFKAI